MEILLQWSLCWREKGLGQEIIVMVRVIVIIHDCITGSWPVLITNQGQRCAERFVSIASFNPHDSPVSSDRLMTPFIDKEPEAQTGSTTSLRSPWQDYDSNSDLLKSPAFEPFTHTHIITRSHITCILILKIIDNYKIRADVQVGWHPGSLLSSLKIK